MFFGGPNSLSHGSGLYCKLSTLVKFLRKAGFVGKVQHSIESRNKKAEKRFSVTIYRRKSRIRHC